MASNPPGADPRTIKQLNSQVNQLRGWVGKDESKRAPLVHTLNELTAQRLLAHSFAEAAMDAQEAVTQAAKVIADHGPVGPYTPMPDAAAYLTALAHVATVQAGLGLDEAAGRTMDAAMLWARQLDLRTLGEHLSVSAAVWTLSARARGAIATGDLALANAFADAIAARASQGDLASSAHLARLAVDAERVIADARWAAGLPMDALAHTRTAMGIYERSAGVELAKPNLGRPKLEVALQPLPGLTRELVARLITTGAIAEAVETARALVDRLAGIGGRAGDTGRSLTTLARADLARALTTAGDLQSAESIAGQASREAAALVAKENPAGAWLATELVSTPVLADVWLRTARVEDAASVMDPLIARAKRLLKPGESAALLGSALIVQERVERATTRLDDAADTRAMIGAIAETLRTPAQAALPDDQVIIDAALGLVPFALGRNVHWTPLSNAEARAGSAAVRQIASEPVVVTPVPRPRSLRVPEEARPVSAQEPAPQPRPAAEPEPLVEPEPPAATKPAPETAAKPAPEAAAEPEPVAAKEPVPAPGPIAEPAAVVRPAAVAQPAPGPEAEEDPQVMLAEQAEVAWQQAQNSDRKTRAAAAEARVNAIRPLFQRQPRVYGPSLVAALDDLSQAKRQTGDWFSFRGPAKEARQIAKALGLES